VKTYEIGFSGYSRLRRLQPK